MKLKNRIKDLFEVAGYPNYKEMTPFEFYKPKVNLEIASFENGEKVFKKVNAVVYKGECTDGFNVYKSPEDCFKVTPLHKIYDYDKKDFIEIGEIWTTHNKTQNDKGVEEVVFNGLDEQGNKVVLRLEKCSESFSVLDLEVDDTHTYFSQGILSHNTFGSGAKANGMVIKRMNYFVDKYSTPVLWISQERANQNMMSHLPSVTGGEAVNFYPSTRFRVTPKDQITRNGEIVGITMKIKNYKNKTGQPFRECLLDLYFKDGPDFKAGIDGEGQYIDMLIELDIIKQHGAWYYMNEDNPDKLIKMQGRAGIQEYFKEHPDEYKDAKKMVDDVMSGISALDANTVQVDEEVEFQKEQKEIQEKRNKALESLAEQAMEPEEESAE